MTKFYPGQKVVALCSYAHQITEGKQYTVVSYEPPCYTENFTWPAYVTVTGDFGKNVTAHTHRFAPVEENHA